MAQELVIEGKRLSLGSRPTPTGGHRWQEAEENGKLRRDNLDEKTWREGELQKTRMENEPVKRDLEEATDDFGKPGRLRTRLQFLKKLALTLVLVWVLAVVVQPNLIHTLLQFRI